LLFVKLSYAVLVVPIIPTDTYWLFLLIPITTNYCNNRPDYAYDRYSSTTNIL